METKATAAVIDRLVILPRLALTGRELCDLELLLDGSDRQREPPT